MYDLVDECNIVVFEILEHLHHAALKGLGKPFNAALEKNMPHPSS